MIHDADEQVAFESHIKPMFRERDRQSMKSHFDLWSYDDVSRARRRHPRPPPRWHHALRRFVASNSRSTSSNVGPKRQAAMKLNRRATRLALPAKAATGGRRSAAQAGVLGLPRSPWARWSGPVVRPRLGRAKITPNSSSTSLTPVPASPAGAMKGARWRTVFNRNYVGRQTIASSSRSWLRAVRVDSSHASVGAGPAFSRSRSRSWSTPRVGAGEFSRQGMRWPSRRGPARIPACSAPDHRGDS